MTPAWSCLAACAAAVALPAAAISGYRALHGAPSCARECHAVIPAAEWAPGGDFAPGGALAWTVARGVRSDNQVALSFAPEPQPISEPWSWVMLAVPVVVVLGVRHLVFQSSADGAGAPGVKPVTLPAGRRVEGSTFSHIGAT